MISSKPTRISSYFILTIPSKIKSHRWFGENCSKYRAVYNVASSITLTDKAEINALGTLGRIGCRDGSK
ncbi:MAG TPA: hypothetical protein VFF56_04600 [Bacillota bacterium]|nr:hypothetical protein [Bacillota bacterium]